MANVGIAVVVLAIVGLAAFYIIREKKKGVKCVGCPHAMECAKAGKDGCGNGTH